MTLEQAARHAQATVLHPSSVTLTGACTDNRQAKPGDIFVALRGERADGHDFAEAAAGAGASAVLAERDPFGGRPVAPVLLVENSTAALGRMAHAWRLAFPGRVAGITGTAGKTTTKELLAHILSMAGKTARNRMNLNSQIGMPVSMLATDGDEAFWVMEAGISHPNDMDELGPVLQPDLAIILNVGAGHSLGLGDKGTAYYKARLLRHMAEGGIALVSADYDDLVKEARALRPDTVFFSIKGKQVPYRAGYLGLDENGRGHYRLELDGEELTVSSALSGPYAAENILAAAAAARLFGLDTEAIRKGVESAPFPAQRFAKHDMPGWTVIDDTYNANPLSARRMLEAAAELADGKDFVCVMGAMGELGDVAEEEHEHLGRELARTGCKAVFWVGDHAAEVEKGLKSLDFPGFFAVVPEPEDFLPAFGRWEQGRDNARKGLVIFKGSRVNRMERLVTLFMERKNHAL